MVSQCGCNYLHGPEGYDGGRGHATKGQVESLHLAGPGTEPDLAAGVDDGDVVIPTPSLLVAQDVLLLWSR